ncbi:MAG: hypothetical protein ACYTFY_12685 [Planctomycetota bacterium]
MGYEAKSWEDLKLLSDEELIKDYDLRADKTIVGINYYLEELRHRDIDRQTSAMLEYTKEIKYMTIVVTIATIINIFF